MNGVPNDLIGTDDAERKQRRKIQNRLNQRARRSRMNNVNSSKTRIRQQRPSFGVKLWRMDEFDLKSDSSPPEDLVETASDDNEEMVAQNYLEMANGRLSTADVELYSQQLKMHKQLASWPQTAPPLSDHLLHLINYNAFRGLFYNKWTISHVTDHLAVTAGQTEKLDIMAGLKRDAICVASSLDIPSHLRPTALQSSREHATWIDLIPFPMMRDNLIANHDSFNHRLLINDLIGNLLEDVLFNKYGEGTGRKGRRLISSGKASDYTSDGRGMIIWGEPHRMESWEVTAGFLERWGWAAEGCYELMRATNQWRALRNEVPLVFERQNVKYLW